MKKFCWILAVFTLPFLAGCSADSGDFRQQSYTADSEEVASIRIDVTDRKIDIVPSSDGRIVITYHESEKEAYDLSLSDDKTLTMTAKNNKEWTDFIGGKADQSLRTIQLQLPEAMLSSLDITTTNEDVTLPSLALSQDIAIDVNNGNIRFDKLDAGNAISLKVKNGDISGTIVGGYDDFTISSSVKKGESNLPEQAGNGDKQLTVDANNGDIRIQFEK